MKVTLFVRESRAKSSKGSTQLPLIICFRNGKMNLWQTTRLSVNPDWWDQDHQQLKSRHDAVLIDRQLPKNLPALLPIRYVICESVAECSHSQKYSQEIFQLFHCW
ncbi:MAG: hypothetical protein KBS72_08235 [Bacteroidales bacterium]|nr:hypothetical protein [Candidatus Cacconaster scatequi]